MNILGSKIQVIQQFYMKFAKSLYKWDLAQYFTPHEVIDFIVELANPTNGEHVYDPACGSADFLISAFRRSGPDAEPTVWGADNSEQAVQISILNMVLNGDGKTQIKHQDSLATYSPSSRAEQFSVVLCNPPFGTKILERRFEVLRKFDMGHKWARDAEGAVSLTDEPRKSQQTGILFAELCVRLVKPGGRVGIILPNGYLGNRGLEYVGLREWLLRHTRIVAIVAFPRFTFKKSGADVSASAVILERRKKPLARATEDADYSFFVGNIESVGWRVGDKKSEPLYKQNQETGALILDDANEPTLDADFPAVLDAFLRSPVIDCFPWTAEDRPTARGAQVAGIDIGTIVGERADLVLDPKRLCEKFTALRQQIASRPHFSLGDVLEPVGRAAPATEPAKRYRLVEIANIGIGDYEYEEQRGWRLPDRAKLSAKPRELFIASIWSSVGKWFMAGRDCEDLIVTNGCTRFRIKPGKDDAMLDVVAGLCSESFRVQMRGFATGSDGLAEITTDDILKVVLPTIPAGAQRKELEGLTDALFQRDPRFSRAVNSVLDVLPGWPKPELRKDHWILV